MNSLYLVVVRVTALDVVAELFDEVGVLCTEGGTKGIGDNMMK